MSTESDDSYLEDILARSAGAYRVACEREDVATAEDAARELGSTLAFLLGRLLQRRSDWIHGGWVDDLTKKSMRQLADGSLEIRGLMIRGKGGTTEQWVEPFFARLQLSDDGAALDWTFAFASEAAGLDD